MLKLKLCNEQVYQLVTNEGIYDDKLTLIFVPNSEQTFEDIEEEFSNSSNTQKLYILNNDGEPMQVITGYTKLSELSKKIDQIISTESVNVGTDEEPIYEENNTIGDVMVVKLAQSTLDERVETLENDVLTTMLALTEIYEEGIVWW